jgi:xanthine/uracil permease
MEHPAARIEKSDERLALLALQHQRHIYGATVRAGVITERRAKAKAARKARRTNRKH